MCQYSSRAVPGGERFSVSAKDMGDCSLLKQTYKGCGHVGLVPLIRLAFAPAGRHLVYLRGMQRSICFQYVLPLRIFYRVGHTPVLRFTNSRFLIYPRISKSYSHKKHYNIAIDASQQHVCFNHIFVEHTHHMNFANDD